MKKKRKEGKIQNLLLVYSMENSISPNIEQVRLTADDAILSKMYAFLIISFHRACVDKGYYTDQYIHNFIRRKARRTPIINRGSF